MSQIMDKLKLGEKLHFKGPRGTFALELNEKREIGQSSNNSSADQHPHHKLMSMMLTDSNNDTCRMEYHLL